MNNSNHSNETPQEREQRIVWLQMGIQNDLYHPTGEEITARLSPVQVETLTRFRDTAFVAGMTEEQARQERELLRVWAVHLLDQHTAEQQRLRNWLALAWFVGFFGWFFAYGFWPRGGQ